METFEKEWDELMSEAGRFFRDTAHEATGGVPVKEVATYTITPIEDAELKRHNRAFWQAELDMDKVCERVSDWLKTVENASFVTSRLAALFPGASADFENASGKVDAARIVLANGRIEAFVRDRFSQLRTMHAEIEPLRAKSTQLQYKIEQWGIVGSYKTPEKVSGFVQGKIEEAQAELAETKPRYFEALESFLNAFADVKRELLQIWREEVRTFSGAGEEAFAFGVADPGEPEIDFSKLDQTLEVLRRGPKEPQAE